MNELIKVEVNDKGQQVVSAKELYLTLGYDKSNWASWNKKNIVENEFAIENEDWAGFVVTTNGNKTQDFAITVDFAKRLSMMARTEVGETIRKYFVECENKLKRQLPNFSDPYDAAIAWANEYKEKQLAIERAKTAEDTVTILTHVNKQYTTTEIAKELNFKSAIELNNKLSALKVQFKANDTWVLYSKYSNMGYDDQKQEVLDNGKVIYHRRWTQLGREFVLKLLS